MPGYCGVTTTEFCLVLVTFNGARGASDGEGGCISDGFTGVGLMLSILSRSGIVLDLIGASVGEAYTDGRGIGDVFSFGKPH